MKFVVLGLLVVHGLIHGMGFAVTWKLAELQGISRVPAVLARSEPSDALIKFLGLVWLVAGVSFLVAGGLVLANSAAWRPIAIGAAVISMIVIVLGWKDAPMGAVANAFVVATALSAPWLSGVPS